MAIHNESQCDWPCPFHAPSDHHMKEWRTIIRASCLVERACPHGIGHPDPDSLAYFEMHGIEGLGVHGCDGCCSTDEDKQRAQSAVNHPSHYNAYLAGLECIDVVEHMSFNIGNAVKYLWRYNDKGNPLEDLQKARWYIKREMAKLSGHKRQTHESENHLGACTESEDGFAVFCLCGWEADGFTDEETATSAYREHIDG